MHRKHLLELLDGYETSNPAESHVVQQIRALVRNQERCCYRDCFPGHVTGSAFVLDHERRHFLLHHHKKLDKWLQFGGHADGDTNPAAVALREAQEESGILALAPLLADCTLPLDLDVHVIPARGFEPEHEHHDFRYAFVAAAEAQAALSDESLALRWFPVASLEQVVHEEGLLRLARKAIAIKR